MEDILYYGIGVTDCFNYKKRYVHFRIEMVTRFYP